MSGGSLDYFYGLLENHVGDFEDRELDNLVKDLAKLFRDREWFLSGDTNEGTWIEYRDAFKEKWFTQHGRQERIEKYLDDIKDEVLSAFGLSDKYCMNCKHWTLDDNYKKYGDCDFGKDCMMHRREHCEKFER